MTEQQLLNRLEDIRQLYLREIRRMWAITSGGKLRSRKGKLVETMARRLVRAAWENHGGWPGGLEFKKGRHDIPLNKEYLDRISADEVLNSVRQNRERYVYKLGCDVQCYLHGEFALAVECKSYAEVAMLKRVLIDAALLKKKYPRLECVLLQLESQLGGDYQQLKYPPMGSPSAHTVMSHLDVELRIITLLKGERRVDEPIHQEKYFKDLTVGALLSAVRELQQAITLYQRKLQPD